MTNKYFFSCICFLLIYSCQHHAKKKAKDHLIIDNSINTEIPKYVPIESLDFEFVIRDSLVKINSNSNGMRYDFLDGEICNTGDFTIFIIGRSCYGIDRRFFDHEGSVFESIVITNCNASHPSVVKVPPRGKVKVGSLFESNSLAKKLPISISVFTVDRFISDEVLRKAPSLLNKVYDAENVPKIKGHLSN